MTPFCFGNTERRMYATFHPGNARRQPATGVLLCNPFGQEAVRLHRLYRLLAERLAARGLHVLRFDFHATGESEGDDAQGDLEGWRADTLSAHAELRARSRCVQTVWFGARLGGAVAAMASADAVIPPDRLVLWEPVDDGPAYISELGRDHARAMRNPFAAASTPIDTSLGEEANGFAVGAPLRRQLEELSAGSLQAARAQAIVVLQSAKRPQSGPWLQSLADRGADVRSEVLEHSLDLASEEALGSALVPAQILQALCTHVMGRA